MTFNYKLVDDILNVVFPLPKHFGMKGSEPINFSKFQNNVLCVDPDALIYFGISKIVIVSPNLQNIVIKIPFNGYFDLNADETDYIWYYFGEANGSDPGDYCLAEWEKYKNLKTYGLNCFVAKTFYYKTIDNIRIFLQEQVIPQSDLFLNSTYTPSKNSRELANKWYKERKFDIEPEWIANCLDKYGESKVKRFLYYCENIDPDILEDAHESNFGYRDNGTPAILDFSNFLD